MSLQDGIVAVFQKCDDNRTGCIHTKTLRELMRLLNNSVWTDTRVQELLDSYGKGDADLIYYEEFFQWLFVDVVAVADASGALSPAFQTSAAHQLPQASLAPLHSNHPLSQALSVSPPGERAVAVTKMLKERPELASAVDSKGYLPLHEALLSRQPAEVSAMLLKAYPEGARVLDKFGSLPLHTALSGDGASSDLATEIFKVYPEASSIRDQATGMLPIHMALMQRSTLPLQSLLSDLLQAYPAGSMAPAPSGDRPIQLAVHLDHGPVVMQELFQVAWQTQLQK